MRSESKLQAPQLQTDESQLNFYSGILKEKALPIVFNEAVAEDE